MTLSFAAYFMGTKTSTRHVSPSRPCWLKMIWDYTWRIQKVDQLIACLFTSLCFQACFNNVVVIAHIGPVTALTERPSKRETDDCDSGGYLGALWTTPVAERVRLKTSLWPRDRTWIWMNITALPFTLTNLNELIRVDCKQPVIYRFIDSPEDGRLGRTLPSTSKSEVWDMNFHRWYWPRSGSACFRLNHTSLKQDSWEVPVTGRKLKQLLCSVCHLQQTRNDCLETMTFQALTCWQSAAGEFVAEWSVYRPFPWIQFARWKECPFAWWLFKRW